MKFSFANCKISSIESLVPENVSYFDDEIVNYPQSERSSQKLKKAMGYGEHRIFSNPVSFSAVATQLLQKNLCLYSDIDALIVVTQTPDKLIPSTSSIISGILGLHSHVFCLDINDGCAGFIKGVFVAANLLNNPGVNKVLLISGDVLSQFVSRQDRNSFPLVGDAINATILETCNSESTIFGEFHTDGSGADAISIPAGGSALLSSAESLCPIVHNDDNIRSANQLVMKGRDVFAFTQTTVVDFLERFLSEYSCSDADRFYVHQANKFILEKVRQKIGISDPKKMPLEVIEKYGNSSSGTIPLAICLDQQSTKDVEKLGKCVLVGFGVGLAYGGIVVDLSNLLNVKLYQENVSV